MLSHGYRPLLHSTQHLFPDAFDPGERSIEIPTPSSSPSSPLPSTKREDGGDEGGGLVRRLKSAPPASLTNLLATPLCVINEEHGNNLPHLAISTTREAFGTESELAVNSINSSSQYREVEH